MTFNSTKLKHQYFQIGNLSNGENIRINLGDVTGVICISLIRIRERKRGKKRLDEWYEADYNFGFSAYHTGGMFSRGHGETYGQTNIDKFWDTSTPCNDVRIIILCTRRLINSKRERERERLISFDNLRRRISPEHLAAVRFRLVSDILLITRN